MHQAYSVARRAVFAGGLLFVPLLGALAAVACSAVQATMGASASSSGGGGPGGGPGTGGHGGGAGGDNLGGGFITDGGNDDAGCKGALPMLPDGSAPGPVPVFNPVFGSLYEVFDLGPVPGAPPGHLGGCVIQQGAPDTLLVATESEAPSGGLYSIKVQRNQCGHIVGFLGNAKFVATTPYIDANLVYGANGVLLYTEWPVNMLSQLLPGAASPAMTTDLAFIGVDSSVGGLGFVPPNLPAAGELRTLTWPAGNWFHLAYAAMGQLYTFPGATKATTLPNGPGGFAYVPAGSPGFPKQSLIVAEWSADKVAVYESDGQGDPVVATRQDFFTSFTKPWGAYFEPQTGDYLFLTWGPAPDRVYVVQGFALPPPPPPPPK